jgi:hypothetical protein
MNDYNLKKRRAILIGEAQSFRLPITIKVIAFK